MPQDIVQTPHQESALTGIHISVYMYMCVYACLLGALSYLEARDVQYRYGDSKMRSSERVAGGFQSKRGGSPDSRKEKSSELVGDKAWCLTFIKASLNT